MEEFVYTYDRAMSYHGHTSTYNKGVLVGNWTEERSTLQAGGRAPFVGQSTSKSTYGAQVVSAQQPLERKDWQRKHVCNGRDIILRHEEPNSSIAPAPGLASISQLTYSKPEAGRGHVQEHLWTGHKATDLHMPPCPRRADAMAAHQQQIQREASESQWATTSHTAAEVASRGAVGGACKRQGCRPAAEGGQPAQIGRKAVGECVQLFDKDWMRIGLRR